MHHDNEYFHELKESFIILCNLLKTKEVTLSDLKNFVNKIDNSQILSSGITLSEADRKDIVGRLWLTIRDMYKICQHWTEKDAMELCYKINNILASGELNLQTLRSYVCQYERAAGKIPAALIF